MTGSWVRQSFFDAVDSLDDGSLPWLVEVKIIGTTTLLIKVDSGADVCCISAENHRKLFAQGCAGTLRQPDRSLYGLDCKRIDVSGSCPATIVYKGLRVDMTMYVLDNVATSLINVLDNVATSLINRLVKTQLGIVARL